LRERPEHVNAEHAVAGQSVGRQNVVEQRSVVPHLEAVDAGTGKVDADNSLFRRQTDRRHLDDQGGGGRGGERKRKWNGDAACFRRSCRHQCFVIAGQPGVKIIKNVTGKEVI